MKLKPYNSEKILKYAEEVKSLYEKQSEENQEAYSIAKLGCKFILSMIKRMESVSAMRFVRRLLVMIPFIKLQGETFNGVSTYPTRLFITGFR